MCGAAPSVETFLPAIIHPRLCQHLARSPQLRRGSNAVRNVNPERRSSCSGSPGNGVFTKSLTSLALIRAYVNALAWFGHVSVRNSALRGQEGACLASRCAAVGT